MAHDTNAVHGGAVETERLLSVDLSTRVSRTDEYWKLRVLMW
jgi:hypothetical protein